MSLEARVKKLEAKQVAPTDGYWNQFRGLTFEQFWDKIGRPVKEGTTGEIYPYEKEILEKLKTKKLLWIKKATGLGITEFFLRWIAWKAINDPTWKGMEDAQVVIVTGMNWDTAIGLMRRLKALFPDYNWTDKETVAIIDGCRIQSFPSNHLDAARALKHPRFILLDEADYFPPGEQDNARTVSERYIGKSNPYIVMVSTPYLPDGLYDRMEKEKDSIYERIFLPYTVGIGYVYTDLDIEKAQKSRDFEREYNLKYGYGIGNIWLPEAVDACTVKEQPTGVSGASKSIGIDMAFGREGQYAIIVSQLEDGKVQILEAHETERTDPIDAANDVISYIYKYGFSPYDKIYVDASNPGFIKTLKRMLGERSDYQDQMDNLKKQKLDYERVMRVIPVAFGRENDQEMLSHAQTLGANGQLAIWEGFTTLLAHMRSARTENDGTLDKKDDSHDVIDALFLNLRRYKYK